MLELIDLGKKMTKKAYDRAFPPLEERMGACQRAARAAGVPVLVVFEGWHAAGKGTIVNRLALALDPRGFTVHTILEPTPQEQSYPWMWRFWNALPEAGRFAIFDHSWYGRVLSERIEGELPRRRWQAAYEEIREFERQLADSGTVILKFWLHIARKEQKQRLKKLAADPATAWRVGKPERRQQKRYEPWLAAAEEMLARTNASFAPWTVVEATDSRHARVKVFEAVLASVEGELARRAAAGTPEPKPMPEPEPCPSPEKTILDRVDLRLSLARPKYERQLGELQHRLFELEHRLYAARVPAVIVYEGWDAAGKGGNIRRLTQGLDPRGYEVVPIGVPTAEELAHHYLWRFWRQVPKAGHIAIFDRSWYGRVLVERVEGLCAEAEWRRAFTEINQFEHQLVESGTAVVKFWLHIDQEEQLRRFQERQGNSHKQWKITGEDWRNRDKWKQYSVAVVEMLERTSTTYAPWTILEADCKLHARVKALRSVADALERAVDRA
jgi:polyphosphate:AMP phosphotransferase